jgi:lysylphosphatidylglycerol synthetase-like protein (DUF2156 family)
MKRLPKKNERKGKSMSYTEFISQLLMIVAIITVFVNIITEVCKKAFSRLSSSKVINLFVLILSMVVTLAVFLAYWQIKQMVITWYVIAAFIVVGFMVAYAAMFGFDKLFKYFEKAGDE